MSTYITFTELLNRLDYELQQEVAFADRGNPEKFRYLPHDQAKTKISEAIIRLADDNTNVFGREVTLRLYDDYAEDLTEPPPRGVVYTPFEIYTSPSGSVYTDILLPNRLFNVSHIMVSNRWHQLGDSSHQVGNWYTPVSDTIRYRGDLRTVPIRELTVFGALLPKWIAENETDVAVSYTSLGGDIYRLQGDFISHVEVGDVITVTSTSGTETIKAVVLGASMDDGVTTIYVARMSGSPILTSPATGTYTFNTDSAVIEFPRKYLPMLVLEIKRAALARKKEEMSRYEYMDLQKWLAKWSTEPGITVPKSHLSIVGYGFGKK